LPNRDLIALSLLVLQIPLRALQAFGFVVGNKNEWMISTDAMKPIGGDVRNLQAQRAHRERALGNEDFLEEAPSMPDFLSSAPDQPRAGGRPIRRWRLLGSLAVAVFCLAGQVNAAGLEGEWQRGDGNARVRIAPCGADICAINTWIKPGTPREKAGDKLVMSVMPASDGGYSGTAFDPQRDMTYKLTITIAGDRMTTRGCIVAGLLCKGIDWTRIN
jgi:uncharacterized protein (DUF2147 family)